MSNWTDSVNQEADKALGSRGRSIDDIEAITILSAARKDFHLPPISLTMLDSDRRTFLAKATKHRNGEKSISCTPRGMTVCTLLHEIAHHFPRGFDHYAGWVWAFCQLCTWFCVEDARGRFAVAADEFV